MGDDDIEERISQKATRRAKNPAWQKAVADVEKKFLDELDKRIEAGDVCPHCFEDLTASHPTYVSCDGTCLK